MLNKKATTLSKITALLHTIAQLEESQIDHDWLNLNVDHIHRDVGRSLQQELFAGLAPQALAAMQPEHVRRAKEADELANRQAYFNSLPKGEPEAAQGGPHAEITRLFAEAGAVRVSSVLADGPKPVGITIGQRYGATVLGERAPVRDHGPPTPEDPMYWRNGAFLDLAEQIDGLRDRGFEITKADYDPTTLDGVDYPITARFSSNHQIYALIRVSRTKLEPYTLTLVREDYGPMTDLIRSHGTTGPGILRTIDAFLAGTKVALSEVPAVVPFDEAITKLGEYLAYVGCRVAPTDRRGLKAEVCGGFMQINIESTGRPDLPLMVGAVNAIKPGEIGGVVSLPDQPMTFETAEQAIKALLAGCWARVPLRVPNETPVVAFKVAIDKLSALLAHQHGCIVTTGDGEVIAESRRMALQVSLCESSDAAKPIMVRVTRASNPSRLEPQAMTFETAEAAINGLFAGWAAGLEAAANPHAT